MFLCGRDSKTQALRGGMNLGRDQSAVLKVPSLGHTREDAAGIWRREMAQQRLRSSSAQLWHAPCKHLEALKNLKTWPRPPLPNIITWAARSRHSKALQGTLLGRHPVVQRRGCQAYRTPFPSPPLHWVTVTKSSAPWS